MDFRDLQFKLFHFDSLPSTNIHALQMIKAGELRENAIIRADFQSSGKGQGSKQWLSEPNKNLLFSLVINMNLPVEDIFILNKLIAISLFRFIDNLTAEEVSIKWPNDILVNAKKIAGLLLQNSIQGEYISRSIIGIGLNVNQIDFPDFDRKPTSLKEILGKDLDLEEIFHDLIAQILEDLNDLESDKDRIAANYVGQLYGMNQEKEFLKDNSCFKAIIKGVDQEGRLLLERNGILEKVRESEVQLID